MRVLRGFPKKTDAELLGGDICVEAALKRKNVKCEPLAERDIFGVGKP